MKSPNNTAKFKPVARVDISKLLPKTTKSTDKIKSNLAATRRNVDQLRRMLDRLSASLKELEAQDELGNFEIQDLMGSFNQAETLASSIMKKRDDTANAIISKV
jgi:uncharacterized protein involved in exopolysaccharide biosynthesis